VAVHAIFLRRVALLINLSGEKDPISPAATKLLSAMDTKPSEDFRETSTLPDLFAPVPRSFDQIYLTNSGELPPPETFHFGTNLGEVAFVALKLWHLTQLHR